MAFIRKPKPIPAGITHKPKPMTWAGLTPQREHKEREEKGIVPKNITNKEPLSISRATTELRRAYPYIFDCVSYAKTHAPERVETDLFYSRFTMPYSVFLDYCLDNCTEQTQYLKEELYHLMKGQPAKYIKTSETESVYGQPVVIIFGRKDPKTAKEKRIKNIGQDKLVEYVQIQVIKELLDDTHGYINLPKAFYAKTRQVYNELKIYFKSILNPELAYRERINAVKQRALDELQTTLCTTKEARDLIKSMQAGNEALGKMDRDGFYMIHSAFEYILANHKKGLKTQTYDILSLCEKCNPNLIQLQNGKKYLHNRAETESYLTLLIIFAEHIGQLVGISKIGLKEGGVVVTFL